MEEFEYLIMKTIAENCKRLLLDISKGKTPAPYTYELKLLEDSGLVELRNTEGLNYRYVLTDKGKEIIEGLGLEKKK
jgi:hypothetical protein